MTIEIHWHRAHNTADTPRGQQVCGIAYIVGIDEWVYLIGFDYRDSR